MLSQYRQHRKNFVQLTYLRKVGNAINNLSETIIDITDDETVKIRLIELRAQEQAALSSMEADIPWICKVIPVK
jgi:hypothetical protein